MSLYATLSSLNPFAFMNSHSQLQQRMREHLERGHGILGPLTPEADTDSRALHRDWMKHQPDDRLLTQLSVPGTHDSAAYNYKGDGHEFWNCQNVPLFRQLDAGIRALDLRYALTEGKLLFFHSTALLDEHAEVVDIIWGLHAWLQEHPDETIFVSLKVDQGTPENQDVQDAMAVVLENTKDYWVPNLTPRTTLKDARGKLVLFRRFPFYHKVGYSVSEGWLRNSPRFAIPITEDESSVAWIEDFFLLQDFPCDAASQVKTKWGHTVEHLQLAQRSIAKDPKDLYVTFSSAVGDREKNKMEDVTPRVMALGRKDVDGVNKHLIDWFQNDCQLPVGIVLMDFATTKRTTEGAKEKEEEEIDLIRAIIEKQMPQ